MPFARKQVRALLTTSVGTIAFLVTAASSAPFAAGNLNLRGTPPDGVARCRVPRGDRSDATACRARTGGGSRLRAGQRLRAYTWSYRMGRRSYPADVGSRSPRRAGSSSWEGEIHCRACGGSQCIA